MSKVLFLCFAILSISYGNPVEEMGVKSNSTLSVLQTNSTKMTVASEGGAIMSNTSVLSLPKENQAFLMTSPADISSNKVKARKGAPAEANGSISVEQNSISSVNQHVKDNEMTNIGMNNTNLSINSSLSSLQPTINQKTKPPIVSVELLEKADLLNNDPAVDDVDERMVKIHKTNSNGHPGMVTPIIITVLVVPIFAMVGYMALKRGQEAWKNRHYKRMDFLLDGMYND